MDFYIIVSDESLSKNHKEKIQLFVDAFKTASGSPICRSFSGPPVLSLSGWYTPPK